MNSIQRRLFRAFAESGGDLTEDGEVERFIRYVEGNLLLLPPKVREAVELLWRCERVPAYVLLSAQVSEREQARVSVATLRQRVSRGVRVLEQAVRRRAWDRAAGRSDATGLNQNGPRRTGNAVARIN